MSSPAAPGAAAPTADHVHVPADRIRSRTIQSLLWRASSQMALQVSRVIVAVILARLLTPNEYGVAGMVLVFSSLVLPFADLGFGAALVQRPNVTERDLSTVFWASTGGGLLFTAAGIALAGPVAAFYHRSEVKPLFMALSLGFAIVSFDTVQRSLLVRAINFRSLELRNLGATVGASALAIAAAAAGFGAWALIVQFLGMEAVAVVLIWLVSPWRPSLTFSLASLRDMGAFGIKAIGARLLNDIRQNADKLVVGRVLGSSPLGIYLLANNIVLLPFSRVVAPMQDVLFPAFSRLQTSRDRVASAWLRVNSILAAVTLPAMLALVVVAPDFVSVVLGKRWHAAVPLIQLLAWTGLMQALQGLYPSILTAMDRAGALFVLTIGTTVVSFTALAVGLHWGIKGVAVAYAISNTGVFLAFTGLVLSHLEMSPLRVARSFVGPATATGLMVAALAAARLALLHTGVPVAARLVVLIVIGAVVYVGASLRTSADVIADLRSLRKGRRAAVASEAPAAES